MGPAFGGFLCLDFRLPELVVNLAFVVPLFVAPHAYDNQGAGSVFGQENRSLLLWTSWVISAKWLRRSEMGRMPGITILLKESQKENSTKPKIFVQTLEIFVRTAYNIGQRR